MIKQQNSSLVEENMGLVYMVAKKFSGRGVDFEDLIQIGCVGLIKASKNFNPELEVKFSTYAVSLIFGEIKRFFRDDGIIKIPRKTKEIAIKVRATIDSLRKTNGYEPTVKDISNYTGLDLETIIEALEADVKVESIYAQTPQETYILDTIPSDERSELEIEDKIFLNETLEKLDFRAKKIITLRFFYQKTQQEVGDILGISQVQVSRLEKKALLSIRQSYRDI